MTVPEMFAITLQIERLERQDDKDGIVDCLV